MRPLRITVVKPDFGTAGGFERLLDRLVAHLVDRGHDVATQPLPALARPRAVWGIEDCVDHWGAHPELFRFFALAEDTRALDLSDRDLVISTQPPTYLVDHPRVLSLFYHQARIFYDLADRYVAVGDVDPARHRAAAEIIRTYERPLVGGVAHWLAGSQECAARLDEFWGIDERISLLHAPPLTDAPPSPPPHDPSGPVVCVSRHEWPKRTELLVAAAHRLRDVPVELVGGGGRLPFVRRFADDLDRGAAAPDDPTAETAWMSSALGVTAPPERTSTDGRVPLVVHGAVDDAVRNDAYARASVVVAPAHREDYGLTALEAMLWHRPLIVCDDGGGLVEIVEQTGAGLVVPPTASGIADGIARLRGDPALAGELVERAAEVRHVFTWHRAHAQLDAAVEAAMSADQVQSNATGIAT